MSGSASSPDGKRGREVTGNVLLWTGRLFIIGCGLWLLITALQSLGSEWVRFDTEMALFFWGPVLFIFGISLLWPLAATIFASLWSFLVTPYFVFGEGLFSPRNIIFPGSVFVGSLLCFLGFAIRLGSSRSSNGGIHQRGIEGKLLLAAGRIGILIGGMIPVLIHLYGLLTSGWSGPGVVTTLILALPMWLILPLSFLLVPAGAILALIWSVGTPSLIPLVMVRYRVFSPVPLLASDAMIFVGGILCLIGWGIYDANSHKGSGC